MSAGCRRGMAWGHFPRGEERPAGADRQLLPAGRPSAAVLEGFRRGDTKRGTKSSASPPDCDGVANTSGVVMTDLSFDCVDVVPQRLAVGTMLVLRLCIDVPDGARLLTYAATLTVTAWCTA